MVLWPKTIALGAVDTGRAKAYEQTIPRNKIMHKRVSYEVGHKTVEHPLMYTFCNIFLHADRIGTTTLAAILFYTVVTTVRVMYRLMQRVRAISERIGNTKLAAIWFYTVVTTERVMYRLMQRVRAISERIGTTTLTAILFYILYWLVQCSKDEIGLI
jgi:hypothetical protein